MIRGFDKLSPNGAHVPFALSLSKGWCQCVKGFDKLSPNGVGELSPNRAHIPFALSLSKG